MLLRDFVTDGQGLAVMGMFCDYLPECAAVRSSRRIVVFLELEMYRNMLQVFTYILIQM